MSKAFYSRSAVERHLQTTILTVMGTAFMIRLEAAALVRFSEMIGEVEPTVDNRVVFDI